MKSGRNSLPQAGQIIVKRSFSSSDFMCFFKLPSSVLVFSITVFSGCISLTSARTLRIMSLTCANVSLSDSIVSYIRSKISLLFSKICVSVVVCFFASDSTLFRKASTGLSKAIRQVIPHRIAVEAAEM